MTINGIQLQTFTNNSRPGKVFSFCRFTFGLPVCHRNKGGSCLHCCKTNQIYGCSVGPYNTLFRLQANQICFSNEIIKTYCLHCYLYVFKWDLTDHMSPTYQQELDVVTYFCGVLHVVLPMGQQRDQLFHFSGFDVIVGHIANDKNEIQFGRIVQTEMHL